MKKRTWAIIFVSIIALIIIALTIAPGIARKVAIKNSKEWVGRQISLDKLKINYFTGSIRIFDFKNEGFFSSSININPVGGDFDLYDSTNNFFEILNYETITADTLQDVVVAQAIETDTAAPLFYAVNSIVIVDGTIDFADNTTSETFKYNLGELEMSVDSISSDAGWIDTYSKMLLNKRGKLVAQFEFNPLNPMDLKLEYVITDFQLSDLNIYSRDYMGFPILYGDMYYKASTEIINNQLTSENELNLEKEQIAVAEAGKVFNAHSRKDYREDEEAFVKFLHKKTSNDTLNLPDASMALIGAQTVDSIAGLFAQKRIDILTGYLQRANDSTSIHTYLPDPNAPKHIGSKPVFEVKYSMK
jgi:hypothetical protein